MESITGIKLNDLFIQGKDCWRCAQRKYGSRQTEYDRHSETLEKKTG